VGTAWGAGVLHASATAVLSIKPVNKATRPVRLFIFLKLPNPTKSIGLQPRHLTVHGVDAVTHDNEFRGRDEIHDQTRTTKNILAH